MLLTAAKGDNNGVWMSLKGCILEWEESEYDPPLFVKVQLSGAWQHCDRREEIALTIHESRIVTGHIAIAVNFTIAYDWKGKEGG